MTTSLAQPPTSYSDHSIMRPSYSDSSPMDYRTPRTTPHFPLHRDSAPAPRPIPPNLTSLPSIHAMVGSIDRPLPPSHTSSPINPTRHRRPSVSSIAGPGFPPSRDSFPAPSSAAPAPPSLYVPRTGADRPTFDASADASPSSAHPSNYAASSFRDDRRYDDRSAYTRYSPARNELVDRTRPGSQGAPGPAYMPHGVPTPPSQPPNSIAGPPPARYGAPSHYPAGQMPLPMAYPGANGYDAAGRAQVVEGHLQNWDYRDLLRRTINAGHTITNFCEHYIRVADEQSGTPTIMSRMPNEREVSEMLNNIDMMRQSLTGIRQHIAERNTLRPEESHTPPRGHAETRKRRGAKRAAPPGRCHSCSRIDTPEWRRGPDGARTLCNACGLHYAKLERKRLSEQRSDSSKGN